MINNSNYEFFIPTYWSKDKQRKNNFIEVLSVVREAGFEGITLDEIKKRVKHPNKVSKVMTAVIKISDIPIGYDISLDRNLRKPKYYWVGR